MAARLPASWPRLGLLPRCTVLLFITFLPTTLAGKQASGRNLAEDSSFPSLPLAVRTAARGCTLAGRSLEFLVTRSEQAPSLEDYQARISALLLLVAFYQLGWTSTGRLERLIAEGLEIMLFAGHRPDEGSRLIAALVPFVRQTAGTLSWDTPLSTRVLQGCGACRPSPLRLPLHLEVLAGVNGCCIHSNLNEMARRFWLCFPAYLKPNVGEEIIVGSLIPPMGASLSAQAFWARLLHPLELCRLGKAYNYDEKELLDVDPLCRTLLAQLVNSRAPDMRLWSPSYCQFSSVFRQALIHLSLGFMGLCIYCLRNKKIPAAALAFGVRVLELLPELMLGDLRRGDQPSFP